MTTPTDTEPEAASSMAEKLKGEGPITLTADEAKRGVAVVRKVNEADGPLHLDADEAATLKAILIGFHKQTQLDALIEAVDRADECRSASAGDAVCAPCWSDVHVALEAVCQVYKPEAVTKIPVD